MKNVKLGHHDRNGINLLVSFFCLRDAKLYTPVTDKGKFEQDQK